MERDEYVILQEAMSMFLAKLLGEDPINCIELADAFIYAMKQNMKSSTGSIDFKFSDGIKCFGFTAKCESDGGIITHAKFYEIKN